MDFLLIKTTSLVGFWDLINFKHINPMITLSVIHCIRHTVSFVKKTFIEKHIKKLLLKKKKFQAFVLNGPATDTSTAIGTAAATTKG